jgi:PEP-CTERM motif
MIFTRWALRLGFVFAAFVLPACAFADAVTGTLDITGGISITSTGIDFLPAGGGTGTILADAFSNTGTFAVLNSGSPASEQSGTIYDVGLGTFVPGSVFITGFSSDPNVTLDLNSLGPTVFSPAACATAPAAGQTCSPALSPYNLVNLPAGTGLDTLLSFSFSGTAVNTATDETSPFSGTLSAQFAGSYQTFLADIVNGTPESSTFSATIVVDGGDGGTSTGGGTTTAPEPGSFIMLLAGLGVIGLLAPLRKFRHLQSAAR